MAAVRELVHGSAIAVGGWAALIRGKSGSGKSDLALRCLALPSSSLLAEGARLVADDQVVLSLVGTSISVQAPPTIRGKLEARGIGILEIETDETAKLALVADLVPPSGYERMPDQARSTVLLGQSIPCVEIAPFEASAPLKLLLALQQVARARARLGQTG